MAKISALCLLALAVALAVAMTAGADIECLTTVNSPSQADVKEAVEFIRKLGDTPCCAENCDARDACTVMFQNAGARALICGQCNICAKCSAVGEALNNVLNKCTANELGTDRCSGRDLYSQSYLWIDVARRAVTNGTGDLIGREMKITSV